MTEQKPSRKDQILQSLAHMLEAEPGGRITTAGLAREVGVSEAALYRHFPSKAKMFEGLIDFIEEAIFSRINRITAEGDALTQVEQILTLILAFTERNPGITRLLTGDALTGENERLRKRILQFYDRVESQLKQVVRDAEFKEGKRTRATPTITANLLLAVVEGRIAQFVRSGFKIRPAQDWPEQWALLAPTVFRD
ncbi:nucleoid occlusion factor SlmA [Alloalcanivorax profundimaris]|jgi:TetR/AcrR family transcriptional regulator|uniref:nucleoid occlusion factor SlmA n=1 Tax=Alloalcanivorax profundimaris TaxID=2735259 RepID=UPI000C51D904|nr:nucleoid occlusion factor SlmA [Alloalcanivorax profundimaris]MAO58238.1 nucleoid occlusion factor SlmA [Alcanivorax sp.]MCQ6262576.1 nucleoid occlusion factor SlmA [Alcanivorax sp. MM125-6]MAY10047.1 nucleoid occlusion factor SlmA [Alcanivorax sp.]MBF1803392.1 nucleoid occlusion factor SlmA [Alloalcanivorax profundimaris]MBI53905.1 nucleoid occlusion factor SlmA [Alcanivorax sp.]|tara:strand:- start:73113 stop:73700 length:588 start_codon:yes stop_codon:yes gene_type:complete